MDNMARYTMLSNEDNMKFVSETHRIEHLP